MTTPDPDDLAAPADPAAYAPPRKGLGLTFWLFMVFGLVCVLAGVAVANLGPKLLPKPTPKVAAQPRPAPKPLPRFEPRPAAPAVHEIDAATPEAARFGALVDRMDRVEGGQKRLTDAAARAIAAAALAEAAAGSRPFTAELEALAPLLRGADMVRGLRPYASRGAPTQAGLAQSFPAQASRAALAARARTQGNGALAQVAQAFAAIVTVRRTDRTTGDDPDAVLSRAQQKLDGGDLAGAVAEIDTLPTAGRDALADWRARARRRLEIDTRISAIRVAALADLARVTQEGAAP